MISSVKQKGATLIATLFTLLIITIVGVLAIRVAMTSLNIATNAQVNQFLSQTADTPINQIYTSDLSSMVDLSGAVGYALSDNKVEPGNEYIFCFRPTSTQKFGAAFNVTTLRPPATKDAKATVADGGASGFCDLTKDFGSKREAVVTQVAVKVPVDPIDLETLPPGVTLGRGSNLTEGAMTPKNMVEQQRIRVTTTAILPSFASDIKAAQACIGKDATSPGYINDNLDKTTVGFTTAADCLSNLGVPVISQVQEFNLQTIFSKTS